VSSHRARGAILPPTELPEPPLLPVQHQPGHIGSSLMEWDSQQLNWERAVRTKTEQKKVQCKPRCTNICLLGNAPSLETDRVRRTTAISSSLLGDTVVGIGTKHRTWGGPRLPCGQLWVTQQ